MAGFRGARDKVTIDFPPGFAVITGPNGTGKSTICDAIEYIFTGTIGRYREVKETGETFENYLWWRGHGNAKSRFVAVTILTDDGKEIEIKRDPNGLLHGLDQEKLLNLFCIGSELGASRGQSLCQTTIIRGEQVAELSLDLAETERFNFVKTALGATDLSHTEEKASEVSKWFKEQASKLQLEYERIRGAIVQITADISAATAQISEADDLAAAESALKAIMGEPTADSSTLVSSARAELAVLRNRVSSLLALAQKLRTVEAAFQENEALGYQSRLKEMEDRLAALDRRRTKIETTAAEFEKKLQQQQQGQPLLESWAQLREHGAHLGLRDGKCPLCASRVSQEDFDSQLKKIHDDITSRNSALIAMVQERNRLSADLQSCISDIRALQRQYDDFVRTSRSLREEHAQVKEYARQILNSPPETTPTPSEIERAASDLRQRAAILEKNLGLLETSKTLERVGQLRKQLEENRRHGDVIDARISKHKIVSERFREAASALKRVSGELVDDRLAELAPLLQEIYSRLRPHVDWTEISYLIRGDVRRFLSLRVGDQLNPKFMFSSGQRRAAGLAFLLAVHLSRSWCSLNSLILDDPVQHIDDYRALHLIEVLHAIRRSGRQIICTVEDEALASLLCRRLRGSEEEGSLVKMEYVPNEGVAVANVERFSSLPKLSILAA
jgi:DNA repair exonuclease SbcCD ATPase subunit